VTEPSPTPSPAVVGEQRSGPRLLAGWADTGRPADLAAHLARYGPLPSVGAGLVDEVAAAGLLGRGGAWFPTGVKLRAVAAGRRAPVVVANGAEGEPVSDKDHALLTVAPHLVLDGVVLVAHALGAVDTVLVVHRGDPVAASVRAALAQRTGDPVAVRVVEVPARFVASEESALVNFLTTGDARPTDRPPRPFERGVRGRPTLVDNVETLADVALIARRGAGWFRSVGTADAPGTVLATVGGAVVRPGVREIALGTTVSGALGASGGLAGSVSAVLVGGFGGHWLAMPDAGDLPLTPAATRTAGIALGVPVLLALPARACGLALTARIVAYLAGESAMRCGPCMFGLSAISQDLDALARGVPGGAEVVTRLRRRLGVVDGRGACAHPDGAVRLTATALTVFAEDVRTHVDGRSCAGAGVDPGIRVPTVTAMGTGWR
jgi:NADH:ubiquinone oxidoreductase subunit F (NADH-binding)